MGARITVENHIATVVLDRPQAMNSIDPEMREELYAIAERIKKDDGIWVAILTGAGEKAFCTGSDLKKTLPTQESFAAQIFAQNIVALGASFETD